jgi:hypothetical protein
VTLRMGTRATRWAGASRSRGLDGDGNTNRRRGRPALFGATASCTCSAAASLRARSRLCGGWSAHGNSGSAGHAIQRTGEWRRRARRSRDRRTRVRRQAGSDLGVAWLVLGTATGSSRSPRSRRADDRRLGATTRFGSVGRGWGLRLRTDTSTSA